MMFHTNVPKRFWGDAVMTACYLINRIPTKVLDAASPFEVLNKTRPSLNHLRVCGCVCFVLVPGERRNKLDAKSTKCMFLGYSTTQKGYKCYDPSNNRTFVSHDVKFLEDQGYYDKKNCESLKDFSHSSLERATSLRFLLNHLENQAPQRQENIEGTTSTSSDSTHVKEPVVTNQQNNDQDQDQGVVSSHDQDLDDSDREALSNHDEESTSHEEEEEDTEENPPLLRRITRPRKPSKWMDTRVYYNNQAVAHPIQSVCSLDLLRTDHQAFLGKIELD